MQENSKNHGGEGWSMNDYGKSVLEQYELDITNVRRGRGCLILDGTGDKRYRLAEYSGSKAHLDFEQMVLNGVWQGGELLVERCIPNRAGLLYSLNREQTGYVMRDFVDGMECSTESEQDLCQAMETLARFHLQMRGFQWEDGCRKEAAAGMPLYEEYARHLRELQRVSTYLRRKKKKNHLERRMEETIQSAIGQGKAAIAALEDTNYRRMYDVCVAEGRICHGRYHYHHVRFAKQGPVLTGLEHCCVQVQIVDVYQFLRKTMEKCGWSEAVGSRLLEAYESVLPLSVEEKQILACMLQFPEKYYKQVNHYYNTRKTWISAKSLEKLEKAVAQQAQRQAFAETFSKV